jgi:hypothetical protein
LNVRQTIAFACACALAALIGASALRADDTPPPLTTTETTESAPVPVELSQRERQLRIDRYRHKVWHWQRVMGTRVTRRLSNAPVEFMQKVVAWKQVAAKVAHRAQNPPHKRAWLCIHHYEATWTDPNPPYYGGLQMDMGFMGTYGAGLLHRKGTADHWTPLEQMWVAERAFRSGRGFYPWPNTARFCGLI